MGRIHRYILFETGIFVLGAVAVFIFVFLSGNAVRDVVDMLASGQVTLGFFLEVLAMMVPYVALYALPLGFLVGILLALGRLSASREILAMKACGISVRSIAAPIFLLAVCGSVFSAWFNNDLGPRNKGAYREKLANILEEDPLRFFKAGAFIRNFPGYIVFVRERNGDEMRGFKVWEVNDEGRVTLFVQAESARVEFLKEEVTLLLTLREGVLEERKPSALYEKPPEMGAMIAFEEFPVRLELGNLLSDASRFSDKPSYLTYGELRERIREDPDDAGPYRVQLQQNFAMSVSVLALALVAVPLGIQVGRKETLTNLGIALGLAMLYYFLVTVATWFSDRPEVMPEVLLWVPNVLYLLVGIWLMRRAERG